MITGLVTHKREIVIVEAKLNGRVKIEALS